MVGLTCCYVLLLKMVLIRAFVANPANVAITRFFCLFFTQKFTQKNRILAEILPKKLAAGGSADTCQDYFGGFDTVHRGQLNVIKDPQK